MYKNGKQFDSNFIYALSAIKSQHWNKNWIGAMSLLTHFLVQCSIMQKQKYFGREILSGPKN